MPRRKQPRRPERRELGGVAGWPRRDDDPGGSWLVRDVPGAQAVKYYRCPGCDQEIPPGTPHVVAWPVDGYGSAAERRHWHSACWRSRRDRGPTRRWS